MVTNELVACIAVAAGIGASACSEANAEAKDPAETGVLELVWERLGNCVGVAVAPELGEIFALERGGLCSVLDSEGRILRSFRTTPEISRLAVAHFGRDDERGGTIDLLGDDSWGHVAIALTVDGETRWERRWEDAVNHALAADLDGDGVDEVIVGFNGPAGLSVLDAGARTKWHSDELGNVWSVAVANVVGDVRPEVLACSSTGRVRVYDGEGRASEEIDPAFYTNVVVNLGRNGKHDRLLLGGEGEDDSILGAARSDGELIWSRQFSADSWAIGPGSWLAAGSMNGRVVVVDSSTGDLVASLEGPDNTPELAWLPGDESDPPRLLIATGTALRAYRIVEGAGEDESREIARSNSAQIEALRLERLRQVGEARAALRELPPLSPLAGTTAEEWREMEHWLAELLPCCPCRPGWKEAWSAYDEGIAESDWNELGPLMAKILDLCSELPVDSSTCAEARRSLLARGPAAVPFLAERLRRCDLSTEDGEREASCVESLLTELVDGHFGWTTLDFDGEGSSDERDLHRNVEVVHAWLVHAPRAGAELGYWEDLALRSARSRGPVALPAALTAERIRAGVEPEGVRFRAVGRLMEPGTRIRARTSVGEIVIEAGPGFERHYTWEGSTRSALLGPASGREEGPLGLYYPGPGEHWAEHKGITRGVLGEKRVAFASEALALAWIAEQSEWIPCVYRNDGWVVAWRKVPERRQLDVNVWRIEIDGQPPRRLQGACDDCITVDP